MSTAFDLEDWYRRFGSAVHRRARRLLGDEALAADVVQETFLRAHRYRASFQGGSALAWLFTIADRCTLDARERHHKRGRLRFVTPEELRLLREEDAALDDPREHATLSLEERLERDGILQLALGHADDETRRILIHRFLDELATDAIATRLALSERTVRRRLADFFERATARLRAVQEDFPS